MSRTIAGWEAEERKLQSVYDDISSHRITSAQSTLTRYLKKNPKSQPALIIKMYILQKSSTSTPGTGSKSGDDGDDKEEEILALYDQIKSLGEMSGRGVWWTGLTLRNMGRLDLALQLYTSLGETIGDSPPILEQIFLHAVAADEIEVAVKSSRKLFNLTRDERWGRAAAWAEWVKNAPQPGFAKPFPPPAPQDSLKIALLLNTSTKSPSTSETVWLKTQILLSAGQLDQALEHLRKEADQGALARLWHRMEGVKEILKRLEAQGEKEKVVMLWMEERTWVATLLKGDSEAQRNYAFYQYLLLATRHTISAPELVQATDAFLLTLHESIGSKERAPALARLELQSILLAADVQSEIVWDNDDWLEAAQAYWVQWGSKGSIVSELEGVSGDAADRRSLLVHFMRDQAATQHTDEQTFREQVNAELYLLRSHEASWTPSMEDAKRYWTLYTQGLQYGKNLPKTDVQPADTVGLVAVTLLLTLWHEHQSQLDVLFKAIVCLEYIVKESPACAHGRYLLIRLYRLAGAPSLISAHLQKLKLSEIQLDNLLHIVTERGGSESVLGRSRILWEDHVGKAEHMYQRTATDFPEYVKECLSNETYSNIPSIQYLHSSLSNSVSHQILIVENARVGLQRNSSITARNLKHLRRLGQTTTEDVVDLRNWDWIFEIGGNRSMVRDLTPPGGAGGVDAKWLRAFGALYLALGDLLNGKDLAVPELPSEGLLPFEAAVFGSVTKILGAASAASSASQSEQADGESQAEVHSNEEIKAVFGDLVRLCLKPQDRWETLQTLASLSELSKIVDLILSQLAELAKPIKGKKKSAPNSLLVGLVNDLKAAKEGVKDALGGVFERIEVMKGETLDGLSIAGDWFEEDGIVNDTIDSLNKARTEALEIARILLAGNSSTITTTANGNGNGGANGKSNGAGGGGKANGKGKKR